MAVNPALPPVLSQQDVERLRELYEERKATQAFETQQAQRIDTLSKWIKILAVVLPVLFGGGTYLFMWAGDIREQQLIQKYERKEHSAHLEEFKSFRNNSNTRMRRIETAIIKQQALTVQAIDYIGLKIDAINRNAAKVAEPKILSDAKTELLSPSVP